jgi:hypothetical protein
MRLWTPSEDECRSHETGITDNADQRKQNPAARVDAEGSNTASQRINGGKYPDCDHHYGDSAAEKTETSMQ